MLRLPILAACLMMVAANSIFDKREIRTEHDDYIEVCEQEPIDLGIVFDSSSSISREDFKLAKKFVCEFIKQFHVGSGPDDVRVSFIPFGRGIYTDLAFNLDTYDNVDDMVAKVMSMDHPAGTRTDTGKGIKYMHEVQFSKAALRPDVDHVALVITDGNSQEYWLTEKEATRARDDDIKVFALGVGPEKKVKQRELLRIAGSEDMVTRVSNYSLLGSIKEIMAKKACTREDKTTTSTTTTTIAPIKIQTCGEVYPSDINFVFSPADLGMDGVGWATSFITNTMDSDELRKGTQYGLVTGSCPDDEGFALNRYGYDQFQEMKDRVGLVDDPNTHLLIKRARKAGFTEANGGRANVTRAAVIFVNGEKSLVDGKVQREVEKLQESGILVFVANAAGSPVELPGTIALEGRASKQQSEQMINALCKGGEEKPVP